MSKRKKQKGSKLPVVLGILAAFLVVGAVLYFAVYRPVKAKVVDKVAEKTITSIAEQAGVDSSVANEIYDSMSEEDQKTVQDLIESHADADTIQKATQMYTDGDTSGLKDLAESELSDEEQQELVDLYQKYVAQ
ncbi:MAG: hypothetical protein II169_07085 [Lachnospiraceae bacterium]|nr:hypothetical protein [Lachnospiraceae bacterium]